MSDIYAAVNALAAYAVERSLIEPEDSVWAKNRIIAALGLSELEQADPPEMSLEDILGVLTADAARRGHIPEGSGSCDRLSAELMGIMTPRPSELISQFRELYAESPRYATDWFYTFCGDTDYIRRARIARDEKWTVDTDYGLMDITVNHSKPEKDPLDIAAALKAKPSGYPLCQLCREAEGYAGSAAYPARANHRLIPIELGGQDWFFQYSPYAYYNEHCIVLSREHRPMRIDESAFRRLLDFVSIFPHYFVGSNADLPIVGGSILSHDHFQGGRYSFAMEMAPVECEFGVPGFEDVHTGLVKWPMSVIRLQSPEPDRLTALAARILRLWRSYSDEAVGVLAETDGVPHNTVTPIARRDGADYQLDLVLRCNITSPEHPLGVFHPHEQLHHIKKENIGLIEVMGLAVLPSRLSEELAALEKALISGGDLYASELTAKHALWGEKLRERYSFTSADTGDILRREVGLIFTEVLEHAGVFKRDDNGRAAFQRFIQALGKK